MKKIVLAVLFSALCAFTTGTCFAGSNVFSSSNEQLGILANYYEHLGMVYQNDANTDYMCHVLAVYAGDNEHADEDYAAYEENIDKAAAALNNAAAALNNAAACYDRMLLTIADPASSNYLRGFSLSEEPLATRAMPQRLPRRRLQR